MTAPPPPDGPPAVGDALSARALRRARELATRREEVLGAAEELFAAAGYERTSLERIAAASGHSVGSIYNLFPSKEAVYAAVLERPARLLVEHLTDCATAPGPGMDRVLSMAATAVRDMRAFPDHARMRLATPTPHPSSAPQREITAAILARYARAIRDGQADGTVRAGAPGDLARYLGGLVLAHIHVDPGIAGRQGPTTLEDFLDVVRAALAPAGS